MKEVMTFIKQYVLSKVFLTFFLLTSFFVILSKFSSINKIETVFEQKKLNSAVSDLTSKVKDIRSVNILRYPTVDHLYVEMTKNDFPIEREVSRETTNKIIGVVLGPNNIKYTFIKSNAADNISFYVVEPLKQVLNPLIDKAVVVIPLIFFLIGILIFYNQKKAKGKYEILLPSDIKGSLNDLIGMDDLKKQVAPLITRHEYLERNKSYNVNKAFNLMFAGPPGTGKTKFAGYLAKELGLPLITGSASSLETGLVGGGSNVLVALHKEAKKLKKCVVFLDEAQGLFAKRGAGSPLESKHRDDTPNTLLAILDGVKTSTSDDEEIIWIFASNFSDANMQTDEAMMRRFKMKLDFRLPNKEERKKLFEMYISPIDKKLVGNIDYDYLAEITSGLSPAQVETTVDLASIACAEDNKIVETRDLYEAFERSTIGMTNRACTANENEKRKLIGVHELGHFVVEFDTLMNKYNSDLKVVRENMTVLKISTESVSKMGALGYVLTKSEEVSLSTLSDLENTVKKLYGGVAAEKAFYGEKSITNGSSNDIQKATSILKTMIFDLGMYSNSKLNYSVINGESKNKELIEQIEKKSEELFKETELIIEKHQALISYLSPVLFEKYVIQGSEILDLIEGFYESKRLQLVAN